MILARDGACTFEGGPTSLILLSSISTAAGASTFPVRGSSSRLALTSVTGAEGLALSCPVEASAAISNASNAVRRRSRPKSSPATNSRSCCGGTCMVALVSYITHLVYYNARRDRNPAQRLHNSAVPSGQRRPGTAVTKYRHVVRM